MLHWKHTGIEGVPACTPDPSVVAVSDGDKQYPAITLSVQLVTTFGQTKDYTKQVNDARAKLLEQQDSLETQIRWADAEVYNTKNARDAAKLEALKGRKRPKTEQKKKVSRASREWKEALKVHAELVEKKAKLEGDVREAERRDYEMLEDIRDTCLRALEDSGLVQEQAESTPPPKPSATAVPEETPAIKEIQSPDIIEQMLKAEDNLQQQTERVETAYHSFAHHGEIYEQQLADFARKRKREDEEVESEFGAIFFKRGIEASQAITTAEAAMAETKKAAKVASVPNRDDQTSDFVSVEGEGYNEAYEQECLDTIDRSRIEKWLAGTQEGKRRRVNADRDEVLFNFEFREVGGLKDNPDDVEECPSFRRKMEGWKERCGRLRRKAEEKRRETMGLASVMKRKGQSKSLDGC